MGGKTATSTSQVTIPPEVMARYNAVNKRAETAASTPFQAYGNTAADYVAQINPQQQAAISNINSSAKSYQPYLSSATGTIYDATSAGLRGTQNASDLASSATQAYQPYLSSATGLLGNATNTGIRQTQNAYGASGQAVSSYDPYLAAATASTATGMGPQNLGALDINQYMSPYIQNVADTTGAMMRQANEQAQSGALGTAASSGAFGGDRAGIAAANLAQQQNMAYGNTMANIYNQGFNVASGIAQGQQAADLAARQANANRLLQGGAQLSSLGLSGANLGLQGAAQQAALAQQGYGMGTQSAQQLSSLGLSGSNLGMQNAAQQAALSQQGYGMGMGSAQATANLGAQEQALGLQGAQAQLGAGTLQQQTEQAGKNAMINQFMQQQGYPFQIAQFLANIAMGTGALSGSTTTSQQPLGIFGNLATGGRVDAYADGGGVAGPRTYSKQGIGGEGYVPSGDLPVGRLMVADVPQRDDGSSNSKNKNGFFDFAEKLMGKADGGGVAGRLGYAGGGSYSPLNAETLRRTIDNRHFLHPDQYRGMPDAGTMAAPTNPANAGLAGHMTDMPQALGAAAMTGPRIITLPDTSAPVAGLGSVPAIPTPPADLGSVGSDQRPMPRPAGLGVTPVAPISMGDLAAAGITGATPATADLSGADVAADAIYTAPMTDTGKIPTGVVKPIVPLDTQINFMMQEPEFQRYLSHDYASPAEAATGMDQYYEISGGSNRDQAAAYANDVYKAAMSGDISGLPENAQKVYNALIQKGIDPIKAAGTVGRLMVESYARVDPNARNILGGGNGTIGIAQWRGPRMEALAKYAGVPLDAITGAPVTTPEGRYYSTTGLGGASSAAGSERGNAGGLGAANMDTKPYEDRNFIGKFFHNRDGTLNQNAIMSVLGGLSAMAKSNTISPISALLQGVGGGMETYKELLKQSPEVTKANIENVNDLQKAYLRAQELNGYTGTIQEFAKMVGYPDSPFAYEGNGSSGDGSGTQNTRPGQQSMFGAPFDFAGRGMRTKIMLDGHEVYAGQSLAWLQAYKNWLTSQSFTGLVDPNLLASVDNAMSAATTNNGQITGADGVTFTDPAVRNSTFGGNQLQTAAERQKQILADISTYSGRTQLESQKLNELKNAVIGMGPDGTGPIIEALLPFRQVAFELGLVNPNDDTVPAQEILRKGLAGDALNQLQAMGGDPATASILDQAMKGNLSGAMTQEAIAHVLAVRAGMNEYNKAFYSEMERLSADPSVDLRKAELEWKNKPENQLIAFVDKQYPIYRDAIMNPPVPQVPAGADPDLWASDPKYREEWYQ